MEFNCNICGSKFYRFPHNKCYCSNECRKESKRLWNLLPKNKEKIKRYQKDWQQLPQSKVIMKKIRKEYRKRCYAKVTAWRNNRRALEKGLTSELVQRVYEDNIKLYGCLTCYLHLKPISLKESCLEHKTPLSRGGTNNYENLAVACKSCNCKKHNKTEKEYKEVKKCL